MRETELTLDEIKKRAFEILCFIDEVCKKNNIRYYIDSGSLLGAVRHKGFIPWDDDIDIAIDRSDYKRFINLINKENSRFKALSIYNNDDYYYLFTKVVDTETKLVGEYYDIDEMGVFVDVFPIDNQPSFKLTRRLFQAYMHMYRMGVTLLLKKEHGVELKMLKQKIVYFLFKHMSRKNAQLKLDKILTKRKDKKTAYKGNVVCVWNPYRDTRSEWFGKPSEVEFEGKYFSAPANYKAYLTVLYGDYMKLPPVEKRVTDHTFKIYLRNK